MRVAEIPIYLRPRVVSAPIPVGDTFDRANSATSIGTASDGATYTTADSFWGILSNQAYNPCAAGSGPGGSAQVFRNGTGATAYTVAADITIPGTAVESPGLLFRVQDNNNFLVAFLETATLTVQVYKVVAGAFTNISASGSVFTLGTTVNLSVATEATVGSMTVKLNGSTIIGPFSDTQFDTLTKIGMYVNAPVASPASRWNNLTVT